MSNNSSSSFIDIYDDSLPQSDLSEFNVTLKPSAYCEFASNQSSSPPVRGKLAKCYDEWAKIGAPGFDFKCYSRRLQNFFSLTFHLPRLPLTIAQR